MRKLYFFLFLLTGMAQAQIVNIPDANFKTLALSACDTDGDGQIQLSEAQAIPNLNINGAGIASLEGLQYFTNIHTLDLSGTSVVAVDLTALAGLVDFNFSNNLQLTSVNVNGLSNLKYFTGMQNPLLATLDINGLTALQQFQSTLGALNGTLDLTGCTNLQSLDCKYNHISALNVSGLTQLGGIEAGNNGLEALNVSGCTGLGEITAEENHILNLDVSGLTNLHQIDIAHMSAVSGTLQPTALNASGCTGLTDLNARWSSLGGGGGLSSLNISGCTALVNVNLEYCQLASVDFTGCTLLQSLNITDNLLTTLDLSDCHHLNTLLVDDNPLQTLFIKNGAQENIIGPIANTIQYICADPNEIAQLQAYIGPSTVCNSYCSFVPGGSYNTISGNVHFDADGNGCGGSDAAIPLLNIAINDGTTSGAAFTQNSGSYTFLTGAGNFTLAPQIENPAYFTVTPASVPVSFANANNNASTQDFCIAPNGIHPDIEVTIVPAGIPARPGFDTYYYIIYRNKGNQILSGNINFSFDDAVMDLLDAGPGAYTQSAGSLTFNYSNLQPFEQRMIYVDLDVNAPTDTPAVNIGDVLNFTAVANPVSGDESTGDNQFTLDQTVVGSFDPNNKVCLEGAMVSTTKVGGYLHYVIHFENTGTAPAQNVVVKDVVDTTKFDIASLQLLQASHTADLRIAGNTAEFIFQNINLAPDADGYVAFKIKTKNTLVNGDSVSNMADIFFDYNAPVATDPANTLFQALGVPQNEADNGVCVFPNPANHLVNIKSDAFIHSVSVYDVQGRIVATYLASDVELSFDISDYANGIYYLKIATDKGTGIKKLVKE